MTARGFDEVPGRCLVALLAAGWCVATIACDTRCGDEEPTRTVAPSGGEGDSPDASDDSVSPREPVQVQPARAACSAPSNGYKPIVAERATSEVRQMLEVGREVGTPVERLDRTWWTGMPIDRCKHLVELPEGATHCSVRDAARGRALVVRVEFEPQAKADASADAESVDAGSSRRDRLYIIGADEGPVALPAEGEVQYLSVAPGLRYAVYDSVRPAREEGVEIEAETTKRIDLESGESCRLAECVRPVVSPENRWVVCRTAAGGVARVSVGGGELEAYRSVDELGVSSLADAGTAARSSTPAPVSFPSVEVLMVPMDGGPAKTFSW